MFLQSLRYPPDCLIPAVQDFPVDAEDEFMEHLPKLGGLSHAEKDRFIHSLREIVGEPRREVTGLRAHVDRLEAENASLRARLAKNSSNSHPGLPLRMACASPVRCASRVSALWGVFPDT